MAKAAKKRSPTTDLVMRAKLLTGQFHIPADDAMTIAVCGATPQDVGASHFALSGDPQKLRKDAPRADLQTMPPGGGEEEREGMSDTLKCCYIDDGEQARAKVGEDVPGCQENAEYEIRDMADPNPYDCITHACTAHVGFMLGHNTDLPADAPNAWEVRELTEEEVNRRA